MKEVSIKCNRCGVKPSKDLNLENYPDIHEFRVETSFGSKFDGRIIEFHLCDDCLEKLNSKFKYDCLGR